MMRRIFLALFFMIMGAIVQVAFSTIGGISALAIIWWLWLLVAIVLLCGGTSVLTIMFMQAGRTEPKSVAVNEDWRRSLDEDFDDSDYVMAKPAKPLVVMRRESSGCVWQIVEDNR